MGYSCTAKAGKVLDAIITAVTTRHPVYHNGKSSSNTWEVNGIRYFYERGREHDDGRITGQVWQMVGERCRRAGSARINADGKIASFPHIPRDIKAEVTVNRSDGKYDDTPVVVFQRESFDWAYAKP